MPVEPLFSAKWKKKYLFYRRTIAHGGSLIPHPYGISLFEHNIFFTDWTKMAVMKANKFADSNPQVIYQSSLRPYGVTVYHSLRQPLGKSTERASRCKPL